MSPGMSNKAVKERSDKGRERLAALDRNAAVDLTRATAAITAAIKAARPRTPLTSTKTAAKGRRRADAQPEDKA